ncbi:hypothetical protein K3N28_05900 [Glycomyces sp. TRM65418]|uniref:hypothetical protein n=1 Tax=Glycomyces sp. TRM65418 TaxID=2867006 RepID=UPI001CE56BD1|nr:hypothetical protein [Glycomyces sp. TRM65418]MCC3762602.1 hypothetical protein [Glycomyces sp. TRM65418]QZD56640.1 hypothetical protein K3N28_05860 [Glycomyces sp. TRM65418]
MKPASVSRLVTVISFALPVLTAATLVWLGITAALGGLDGSIDRPLALAGVAVCALGITGCALWAGALVRERRRPPIGNRPM